MVDSGRGQDDTLSAIYPINAETILSANIWRDAEGYREWVVTNFVEVVSQGYATLERCFFKRIAAAERFLMSFSPLNVRR